MFVDAGMFDSVSLYKYINSYELEMPIETEKLIFASFMKIGLTEVVLKNSTLIMTRKRRKKTMTTAIRIKNR